MATNLALDDRLIEQVQKMGGHKTKKAAVTDALLEYIERRKQKNILALFGTLDWQYDYKEARTREKVGP